MTANNGNYTFVQAAGNATALTITAKPITVTADTGQSKVFGAADPTFTYTSSDLAATFTGALSRVAGENVTTSPYAITQGTLANTNYAITFVPANFAITPAAVTVTADAGQSKVIGAIDPALTFTSSDPAASFTGALSRAPGEDIGTYAITQGNLSAGSNYTINFVPANFTITAKDITVTAEAKSKVYGASDPALTYTASESGVTFTGGLSRASGETVGTYVISRGNLSAGSDYTINFVPANFTITAKPIAVTAEAKCH